MNKLPLVSVIMPVCNCEKYVYESVRSILEQTYRNFELIIVDDASTDNTRQVLKEIKDSRIQIHSNSTNLGNYPSRNIGIRMARGNYLFVMDADDRSLPTRIEKQLSYMISHPEVGICSTAFKRFGDCNEQVIKHPSDYDQLKISFLDNNHCLHPGLCIRKDLFPDPDSLFYNEQYRYASDYDFVSRNFRNFTICNLPDVLIEYRVHQSQITSSKYAEQQEYADRIRINYLSYIGLFPVDEEKEIHLSLIKGSAQTFQMKKYLGWCDKIIHLNMDNPFFENELLIRFLREKLKVQIRIQQYHSHPFICK